MAESYNGAALIGMCGKDCVALACDTRLGVQLRTIDTNFNKVFKVNDRTMVGLSGLATDIQTVSARLHKEEKLYSLEEGENMKASMFANMVSHFLYQQRFAPYFVNPIVAGLDYDPTKKEWKPILAGYDLIGCMDLNTTFSVGGTCSELLYGACESFFKEGMGPEELFEVISQALLSSIDRDILSGWGAVVHVLTPTQMITRKLLTRVD